MKTVVMLTLGVFNHVVVNTNPTRDLRRWCSGSLAPYKDCPVTGTSNSLASYFEVILGQPLALSRCHNPVEIQTIYNRTCQLHSMNGLGLSRSCQLPGHGWVVPMHIRCFDLLSLNNDFKNRQHL